MILNILLFFLANIVFKRPSLRRYNGVTFQYGADCVFAKEEHFWEEY